MYEKLVENVRRYHRESREEPMREWFFEGHVLEVVKWVERISADEGFDAEPGKIAALYHDIARCEGVYDDPACMERSLEIQRRDMQAAGYAAKEIDQVGDIILKHGCKNGAIPSTPAGKAMVTGDALAHLIGNFYFILPFNGWLKAADTYEGYRQWLLSKIERDFRNKIFFEKYRAIAAPYYNALKLLFGSVDA